MTILNLKKASIEELNVVKHFLEERLLFDEALDNLIDLSIRNYFNQYDEYDEFRDGESELNFLLYEQGFQLIHHSIIIPNINIFININQTLSIHNTKQIILTSIKNEIIRRRMQFLQTLLPEKEPKIDIRFKL